MSDRTWLSEKAENLIYDLGCRDSCMGWVNEKAEMLQEKLTAAEASLSEAQKQNEARWIIWGEKVEQLEQQLVGAAETISKLREEIEDDNTSVRQVARECRLDDERTIADQAATISQYKKTLADMQPRSFPFDCELCGEAMNSTDDYEWHGIGDCAPICPTCNGNGYVAGVRTEEPSRCAEHDWRDLAVIQCRKCGYHPS
jgi:hypothetical protein